MGIRPEKRAQLARENPTGKCPLGIPETSIIGGNWDFSVSPCLSDNFLMRLTFLPLTRRQRPVW